MCWLNASVDLGIKDFFDVYVSQKHVSDLFPMTVILLYCNRIQEIETVCQTFIRFFLYIMNSTLTTSITAIYINIDW